MGDGVGLITDEVVESVGAVGVDEAVADPFTSSYTVSLAGKFGGGILGTHDSLMSVITSKAASTPSSSTCPDWTAST